MPEDLDSIKIELAYILGLEVPYSKMWSYW
jgi:hypothetical protein